MIETHLKKMPILRNIRKPFWFLLNETANTHSIEDGNVYNRRNAAVINGLRAVRPHVLALAQIDVTVEIRMN